MFTKVLTALVLPIVAAVPGVVSAAPFIGVDFTGDFAGWSGGVTTAATDVAGAPGVTQANWNVASGGDNATRTTGPLTSATGASTGVTLTYSSSGGWISGTGNSDGTRKLLDTGIRTVANTAYPAGHTLTFNNVPTGIYDVYIYAVGQSNGNDVNYTLGSTTFFVDEQPARAFDGSFITATGTTAVTRSTANLIRFTNVNVGNAGAIQLSISATEENLVSGIQLVAVPEPATAGLLGLAVGGIFVGRRR